MAEVTHIPPVWTLTRAQTGPVSPERAQRQLKTNETKKKKGQFITIIKTFWLGVIKKV